MFNPNQGFQEKIMPQMRFAGEAILDNPQLGRLRDKSSIRASQTPGGDFEATQTEKQLG